MYHLGVGLTGNPFDFTSPLLALQGGRGARNPTITEIIMVSSTKSSYLTALELSSNDELMLSTAGQWPRFITLEAELSESQPKPLANMSPFLTQKGIQGIVGHQNLSKSLNLVLFLSKSPKNSNLRLC